MNQQKNKALFLDRDGVINVDKSYVYKFEDVEWMPGIIELIQFANQHSYKVIVLTNQSGIDRGYYTEKDVEIIHEKMKNELRLKNAIIDAIYYCKDLDSEDRKPNPGMMLKAERDFNINLKESFMIGDKESDILNILGPKYFLIKGNYDLMNIQNRAMVFPDLFAILDHLKSVI